MGSFSSHPDTRPRLASNIDATVSVKAYFSLFDHVWKMDAICADSGI